MRETPPQHTGLPPSVRRWQERQQRREVRMKRAEGPAVPVLATMLVGVLLALVAGWLAWGWQRRSLFSPVPQAASQVQRTDQTVASSTSLRNAAEQLNQRLEALQINRAWFKRLMEAADAGTVMEQDAWLVLIQQLPLPLHLRLGRLRERDLYPFYNALEEDGIDPQLFEHTVHGQLEQFIRIADLDASNWTTEPWRQLWLATALDLQPAFRRQDITVMKDAEASRPATGHGYLQPGESAVFKVDIQPDALEAATPDRAGLASSGYRLTAQLFGSEAMKLMIFKNGMTPDTLDHLPVEKEITFSPGDDLNLLITNKGLAGGFYSYKIPAID